MSDQDLGSLPPTRGEGEGLHADVVARALCAERCASYGDPPCWSLPDVYWDGGKCDSIHDCDCASMAKAVLRALDLADHPPGGHSHEG